MNDLSADRDSPADELALVLSAYESLWMLSDSRAYEGAAVSALLFQLNKRFSDELARIESAQKVAHVIPLRPV